MVEVVQEKVVEVVKGSGVRESGRSGEKVMEVVQEREWRPAEDCVMEQRRCKEKKYVELIANRNRMRIFRDSLCYSESWVKSMVVSMSNNLKTVVFSS